MLPLCPRPPLTSLCSHASWALPTDHNVHTFPSPFSFLPPLKIFLPHFFQIKIVLSVRPRLVFVVLPVRQTHYTGGKCGHGPPGTVHGHDHELGAKGEAVSWRAPKSYNRSWLTPKLTG